MTTLAINVSSGMIACRSLCQVAIPQSAVSTIWDSCWNATLVTFSRVLDFYFRITYMRSLVLKTVTCGHLQCYSAYHLRCHVSNYCRSTHHLQHWPFQTLA